MGDSFFGDLGDGELRQGIALIGEENVAYLFGRELYQGTFVALKGKKEKCWA